MADDRGSRWVWVSSILFLLCLPLPAFSDWQSFNTQNGLPDDRVVVVLEDRFGRTWFGTEHGVVRYDGLNWTFSPVGNNLVRAGLIDRDGNLWFGTAYDVGTDLPGTLWRFDMATSTWEFVPLVAGSSVSALGQDSTGTIWVSTDAGLVRQPASGPGCVVVPGAVARGLFTDRSGRMWLLGGGNTCFDPGTCQMAPYPLTLSGEALSAAQGADGRLWFGTSAGATSYDPATGQSHTWTAGDPEAGPVGNRVQAVLHDSAGRIWFATSSGVSRFDGSNWRHFTRNEGLIANDVRSLMQDQSGNLWFGTGGGASRFDGANWTPFRPADTAGALVDPRIQAIAADSLGRIWFATKSGGITWTNLGSESPIDLLQRWGRFGTDLGDGLASNDVKCVLADSRGFLWFGTYFGASRLDPATRTWRPFNRSTTNNRLADDRIETLYQDREGNVWFGTPSGVSRLDVVDSTWQTFTVANTQGGLASDDVLAILEDRDGHMWFGTEGAFLCRFSAADSSWNTYNVGTNIGDPLSGFVRFLHEDRAGRIWTSIIEPGSSGRLVHHDPASSSWSVHRAAATAGGLGSDNVHSVREDAAGVLWFGTESGLSRFNGTTWKRFSVANTGGGLPTDVIPSLVLDRRGALWLGTNSGASRYEPDRVGPQTLITLAPPDTSGNRLHSIPFTVAYGEADGIEYSTLLADVIGDVLDPSQYPQNWSAATSWLGDNVADGTHYFGVRSRDGSRNSDPTPAIVRFVVEATPPSPILTSPIHDAVARGLLEIRGTTLASRFRNFSLNHRTLSSSSADSAWQTTDLVLSRPADRAAADTLLGTLDTRSLTDGSHELRLSVTNSLNLTGNARVIFRVDNHEPRDSVTSPVQIGNIGGDAYTQDGNAHVYFPPNAFPRGAQVILDRLGPDDLPGPPATGVVLLDAGYAISWGAALLAPAKVPTLDLKVAASDLGRRMAVWRSSPPQDWIRVGGTVEEGRIFCPLQGPGSYALYEEDALFEEARPLVTLHLTPRVLQTRELAASSRGLAITFQLGRASTVVAGVYNRAGRRVRDLRAHDRMASGNNVIFWDGRDDSGTLVRDGLYVITVESDGATVSKSIAVTE